MKRMKKVLTQLDATGGKPPEIQEMLKPRVVYEEVIEEVEEEVDIRPKKSDASSSARRASSESRRLSVESEASLASSADPMAGFEHGSIGPDAEQAYDKSHLRCWKFRNHPMVVRALDRWWHVNENSFDDVDGDGVMDLTCNQYLSILRKVAKALIHPSEYDPIEVEDCARDDWATDSHGLKFMEKEYFCDAIFEVRYTRVPRIGCDLVSRALPFLD